MCLSGVEVDRVITGMAQGWDHAIADACVFWSIPFTCAIPFEGQERTWPMDAQEKYHRLLRLSGDVQIICGGKVSNAKYQHRNRWMVDHCDSVLALWNGTKGGTSNCVAYAEEVGKKVINAWPTFQKTFGKAIIK